MFSNFFSAHDCNRSDASGRPVAPKTKRQGLLSRLARERSGNVAIIFALTMMPVIGLIGGAVEFGQAVSARTKLQTTIDSAVLAAGREFQVSGSQSAALARAVAFFNEHMSNGASGAITVNSVDPVTNTLTLGGQVVSPTPFMSVVGVKNITMTAQAQAVLAVGGNSEINLEISLMLDTTGSMRGSKMVDLKAAAKDLIDIIVWDDQSEWYSKVALAPFSPYVNVGSGLFRTITGYDPDGSQNRRTCVKERKSSSYRYTDAYPSGSRRFVGYGRNRNGSRLSSRNSERRYDCQTTSSIVPLTKDKSLLKGAIDGFPTSGSTAGHLGTAWSWYLLSPNWSGIWQGSSVPAAYGTSDVRKIAVLMTDGQYNRNYYGSSSTSQARTLCGNMKSSGIEVYTIGFQVTGTARTTLRDYCATDRSHHYDASSGDALRQAFRDIALRLAQLRLSK